MRVLGFSGISPRNCLPNWLAIKILVVLQCLWWVQERPGRMKPDSRFFISGPLSTFWTSPFTISCFVLFFCLFVFKGFCSYVQRTRVCVVLKSSLHASHTSLPLPFSNASFLRSESVFIYPVWILSSSSPTLLSGVAQRVLSFLNPSELSRPHTWHLAYATLSWFYLACSRLILSIRWAIPQKANTWRYSNKQQHIVFTLLFHSPA